MGNGLPGAGPPYARGSRCARTSAAGLQASACDEHAAGPFADPTSCRGENQRVPGALVLSGRCHCRALARGTPTDPPDNHCVYVAAGTPNADSGHPSRGDRAARRAVQGRFRLRVAREGKPARRRPFMLTEIFFQGEGNYLCLLMNACHVSGANDRTLSPPRRLVSRTTTVPSSLFATSTQFADSEKELLRHVDAGA